MKKALSLFTAVVMTLAVFAVLAVSVSAEEVVNREFTVYMVTEAPEIDGVIEDGEYPLITSWPDDTDMKYRGDYVQNIKAYFYMCYDADYLYYAVKTECDAPHVAMMDNAQNHFVFNAHHLMSLIIPDDPTNEIYPDETATWEDLYNGGFCYEWTMIFTSEEVVGGHEEGVAFATDHFRNLIAGGTATYACGSDGDWDTYEIKIPWTSMFSTKQPTALTGTEGTVFGMDFTIGLTDVNDDPDVIEKGGYDGGADGIYKGNYLYLADCYYVAGAKALNGCAIMTLGGEYQPIIDPGLEDPSEPSEPSEPAEPSEPSEPATPPTGDAGLAALAIISAVALLGGAVIVRRK